MTFKPAQLEPLEGNTPTPVTNANANVNRQRGLPYLSMKKKHDRSINIVANGPSLKRYWVEPILCFHEYPIISMNGSLQFLLERNIVPEYFMLLDQRPVNVEFFEKIFEGPFDKVLLDQLRETTTFVIGLHCDPSVFDYLEKQSVNIQVFMSNIENNQRFLASDECETLDLPQRFMIEYGPTVLFKSVWLALIEGFRDIHVFGCDSSMEDDKRHAVSQSMNEQTPIMPVKVREDGKTFYSTAPMINQAYEFLNFIQRLAFVYGLQAHTYCDGLLHELNQYADDREKQDITVREREKYETMWSESIYRGHSPGATLAERAVNALNMKPGSIVVDFGCGTGRSLEYFYKNVGVHCLGVDIASNALEVDIPFIQKSLWDEDLIESIEKAIDDYHPPSHQRGPGYRVMAHYGYCTDVLEHIPMEKLDTVLRNITGICHEVFFNIATRPDKMGAHIGKRLHVSVFQAEFWIKWMKQYIDIDEYEILDGEVIILGRSLACHKKQPGI